MFLTLGTHQFRLSWGPWRLRKRYQAPLYGLPGPHWCGYTCALGPLRLHHWRPAPGPDALRS
jgi:hypothetical protein